MTRASAEALRSWVAWKWVCRVSAALLGLDLLYVVLSSGASSLLPLALPIGPVAFWARLGCLGCALACGWRWDRARLALLLLALPTLAHYQFMGTCLGGDGLMYFVQARSLCKDGDINLENEYAHYGLLDDPSLRVPTRTGLRRTIFSVGPAVLWSPFFLLGEAVGRLEQTLGGSPDLSGYGPLHINAVCLGSIAFGVATVLLIHAFLRRHFGAGLALGAALLTWGATFLHWYMVFAPTMSHTVSACSAALALLVWDRWRPSRTLPQDLLVGLVFGLALCARWQNAILLAVPATTLVIGLKSRGWRRTLGTGAALAPGIVLGALPQMLAWKAMFGMYLLPYPPQGIGYLRLDHPFVLNTLFSSRHGLLSWTPVFWLGLLGLVPLLRRRRDLALPLLAPFLLLTYVNMCAADWWGGGAFSGRRFDSLLPIFALGFAASLEAAAALLRRRPTLVPVALTAPFVVWNGLLMAGLWRGAIGAERPVSFPRLVGVTTEMFADRVGSPNTWPASWLFALRHGRSPAQYDTLVGRYLFYRNGNMQGQVDVGSEYGDVLLGEGWGAIEERGAQTLRAIRGRARLFAPLDLPEGLWIDLRGTLRDPTVAVGVRVLVNGRVAGGFLVDGRQGPVYSVRCDRALWREDLNEVVFLTEGGGDLLVNRIDFRREGR
jgi:hypothetical protein